MRPPVGVPRGRDYWRILARGWLVILGATVLSALAVVVGDRYLQAPVYVASTQLFAVVPGDAQTHAAYEGNRGGAVRIDTYASLATSTIVTLRTIDELGLSDTPEQLAERISVRSVPDTLSQFSYPLSVLLNVQVSGSDPSSTVDVANAVARNLSTATQELEWSGSESGPALVIIDEAKSAAEARHSRWYNASFGGAVGLVLSCLAVLATGLTRDRILNRDQLAYVAQQTGGAQTDESA
jgi:capsular polysaccharide biosynthesis protein